MATGRRVVGHREQYISAVLPTVTRAVRDLGLRLSAFGKQAGWGHVPFTPHHFSCIPSSSTRPRWSIAIYLRQTGRYRRE